jgi:hypothetical protein
MKSVSFACDHRLPNHALNCTARTLRSRAPSALRASAAG